MERAAGRWARDYPDHGLVGAVAQSTKFADLPSVQAAIREVAQHPFDPVTAETLQGKFSEASVDLSDAVRLDPNNAPVRYMLAEALAAQGRLDDSLGYYSEAVKLEPKLDKSPRLHDLLGMNYAQVGRFREAILSAQKALNLARTAGNEMVARQIERRIELYKQNKSFGDSPTKNNDK